jgi:hypothetical protein
VEEVDFSDEDDFPFSKKPAKKVAPKYAVSGVHVELP